MRRSWQWVGIIFSVFILTLACRSLSDAKILYLAHGLPKGHPVHRALEVFAADLMEKSNGKLSVNIFPDGQLGSEREILELLQIGSIAMTKVSAAAMANFAPEYKILGVPYLFRDKEHLFKVLESDIGKEILNAGSKYLLKGLGFYDAGSRSFYTRDKAIRTPEDLKGLKIRVMTHKMSVDMVNAMGASATPMAYGEIYTALQQGVVDGAENSPPSFVTAGHYEVCRYYTLDEHSSIPDVIVIGTRFWNTLSALEKKWVSDAIELSVEAQKKFWKETVDDCMVKIKDANIQIIRPDKSLFATKSESILKEFAKDEKTKSLIDQIRDL